MLFLMIVLGTMLIMAAFVVPVFDKQLRNPISWKSSVFWLTVGVVLLVTSARKMGYW